MRRLAQFVRLLASRVCLRLFTSRVPNACVLCVCVCLLASMCVCLTSVVLSRVGRLISRLCASARVSRLSASVVLSRVSRLSASVSRLSASACICLACVSRLSASAYVKGFRMLASVSRLCASVCVGRLVSRVSVLVNACGNWLILCVGRHSKSLKGFCYRHTIAVHIDYVDYMNRPLIF